MLLKLKCSVVLPHKSLSLNTIKLNCQVSITYSKINQSILQAISILWCAQFIQMTFPVWLFHTFYVDIPGCGVCLRSTLYSFLHLLMPVSWCHVHHCVLEFVSFVWWCHNAPGPCNAHGFQNFSSCTRTTHFSSFSNSCPLQRLPTQL